MQNTASSVCTFNKNKLDAHTYSFDWKQLKLLYKLVSAGPRGFFEITGQLGVLRPVLYAGRAEGQAALHAVSRRGPLPSLQSHTPNNRSHVVAQTERGAQGLPRCQVLSYKLNF